jgi:hydroxymethylpyrimidine kinase/phosphomethylpyrimidine kinase
MKRANRVDRLKDPELEKGDRDMKRILTIAGSDSGGGAGIQADLKTITLLGGYGASALTALTAQNTVGVQSIYEIPASFVGDQIDSVLSDIGADAIKTGMLANREIIDVVSKKIKQYKIEKVVVDPVMVAKSGDPLLRKEAREAMIEKILPLAWVVTPNLPEASVLAGFNVATMEQMKKAAQRIHSLGARNVVVKGGHLKGMAIDLLHDGKNFVEMKGPRLNLKNTHGTGCTFASALATFLAGGDSVPDAARKAKTFITMAIQSGIAIGKGIGPTNPSAYVLREVERYRVIQELKKAVDVLKEKEMGFLIPEISSNLCYALPYAEGIEDVAAFPGRIVRLDNSVITWAGPEFGASRHMAYLILTVMKFDPDSCSVMNIRYSKERIAQLKKEGFLLSRFDRRLEPKTARKNVKSSVEWGIGEALKKAKRVPDFIYDEGDIGMEPQIRVIGKSPMDVVAKILKSTGIAEIGNLITQK